MSKRHGIVFPLLAVALIAFSCSEDETTAPVSLDMQEAIDKVKEDILPDAVPEGANYFCLRMDSFVPKGAVIEEDAPIVPNGGQQAPRASLALTEDSYLFYLDLEPGAMFAHDLKYIIVGKSGRSQVVNAQWWPLVDGSPVSEFQGSVPDEDRVIAGNVTLVAATGTLMQYSFPSLAIQFSEGCIAVEGLMPGENLYDQAVDTYLQMINFFNEYKAHSFGSVEVEGLVQGDADEVLAEIDSMVAAGKNPITIAIIAHGNVNYVRLGGLAVTAVQFHDKMAAYPSTNFNILICSCHSGSFMDELTSLANVLTAHTASRGDESAWPDWDTACGNADYNSSDKGAEWTSSVFEVANKLVTNSTYWDTIKRSASSESVPAMSMLLHESCFGALGVLPSMGCTQDLDLAHRCSSETPQGYAKWEVPGR